MQKNLLGFFVLTGDLEKMYVKSFTPIAPIARGKYLSGFLIGILMLSFGALIKKKGFIEKVKNIKAEAYD